MHCPAWALLLVALPVLLNALKAKPANPAPALNLLDETAKQELDLLEKKKKENKKWNWKEASEESKTEWAIVLKRYVLADMTIYELARHFGEALPNTSSAGDREEALDMAQKKLARLQSSLERAVLDQNTSDATAGDMQKDRKTNLLTAHEKRILAQEHKREQYGFFAIEASGQDVLEKATELIQSLDATQSQPKKVQPSWSSIVAAPVTPKPTYMSMLNVTQATAAWQRSRAKKARLQERKEAAMNAALVERWLRNRPPATTSGATNSTVTERLANLRMRIAQKAAPNKSKANATALRSSKPSVEALFQRFEAAAKTFHGDLGNFETMQSKAMTNFLAISD